MFKKLSDLLLFSALALGATSANADHISWLNITSNPGFTYSVSPATTILFYDGNITPQNPTNIQSETEAAFNLATGSLNFVSACNADNTGCSGGSASQSGGVNTFNSQSAFNYLAVHFGQGELLFYWANPITSFSFNNDDDGLVRGLSNYRAYSNGVSTVPVPASVWLLASALGFFGIARRRLHNQ